MDFILEDRGGINVIVFTKSGGCRPASDVESDLFAALAELKGKLADCRVLINGAKEVITIFGSAPLQRDWRDAWLNDARKALKEAGND